MKNVAKKSKGGLIHYNHYDKFIVLPVKMVFAQVWTVLKRIYVYVMKDGKENLVNLVYPIGIVQIKGQMLACFQMNATVPLIKMIH